MGKKRNRGQVAQMNGHAGDAPGAAESQTRTENGADTLLEGLIVDGSRGLYRVETPVGALSCTIRGKLRKQLIYPTSASAHKRVRDAKVKVHDPVAIGDRVRVLPTGGDGGVIEEVVARAGGAFTRRDPQAGGGRVTAVAGLDLVVPVFAAREPEPHLGLLDRFLVLAEAQDLAAIVCVNKADLGVEPWLEERLAVYRRIGYPVLLTSASSGAGVAELRAALAGRTSALLGPSGVGKSSLLNALQPDLYRPVSAVSDSTGKGRHTTTGTRLYPLDGPEGGYIADTAGIRALAIDGTGLDRLDWAFREFRPYLGHCALTDCRHLHEPRCAVRDAVRSGAIDEERYRGYRRLAQDGSVTAAEEWADVH